MTCSVFDAERLYAGRVKTDLIEVFRSTVAAAAVRFREPDVCSTLRCVLAGVVLSSALSSPEVASYSVDRDGNGMNRLQPVAAGCVVFRPVVSRLRLFRLYRAATRVTSNIPTTTPTTYQEFFKGQHSTSHTVHQGGEGERGCVQ